MRYRELEYIQGDFRKRIAPFVILSCLLHVAFVFYFLSLPSYQPLELAKHREPILVDYVENKEGTSPEPASLAPTVGVDEPTPQAFQPATPPLTAPPQPPAKTEERKSARIEQPKPERKGVTTKKPEKPKKAEKADKEPAKVAKLVEPAPKPLPSARDLIPSVGDLMSWQTPKGNMYRSRFEQDGMGRNAAQVQYNAYLAILKQRVKQRWNVSHVTGVRDATTVVWFLVDSDGSLKSLELARPSGKTLLDKKAMDAIRGSFPLTPPPKELLDENGVIPIQFTFRYMVNAPYSQSPWTGSRSWVVD